MTRIRPATLAALAACAATAPAIGQTIFSPTQADLLGLAFADFVDNPDPDNAALLGLTATGTDSVRATFRTDLDVNDNLFRVALEGPVTADLTGLNAFSVTFSDPFLAPAGVANVAAQLFVRSAAGSAFTGNGQAVALGASPTTLSITPAQIIAAGGDPADITSFGVEFFGGDEFLGGLDGAMVTLSTSSEPPSLVDNTLFSWETGLERWDSTPIVPAAHTEVVRQGAVGAPAVGATNGINALQITRVATANTFEWGSAFTLDAFANAAPAPVGDYNTDGTVNAADYTVYRDNLNTAFALPNRAAGVAGPVGAADLAAWRTNYGATGGGPDPGVQAQIDDLVAALNDPSAYSIAFDVTVEDQFPNDNPGFLVTHLAIATDGGPDNAGDPFFQNDAGLVTSIGAGEPVTIELPLSGFRDVSPGSDTNGMTLADVGIAEGTGFLTFHLASNLTILDSGEEFTFTIDNFRIRSIAPASVAVPEPNALVTLAIGVAAAAVRRRG